MRRIPQLNPRPLKIHDLLAFRTVWTNDLWNEVLEYLLASVNTREAEQMTWLIYGDDSMRQAGFRFKIDYLREFRPYPPSVVLAAFDLVRLNRM